jgi:endonuclease/exonuclease/phosphatase family metal-dependent hydrolase
MNTHLSLHKLERQKQLRALMNRKWLMSIPDNEPIIFCGDLNAGGNSKTYRTLSKSLMDVQKVSSNPVRPKPTFHAKSPMFRIDHMFVSKHVNALNVEVKRNRDTHVASDHLPLIAELAIHNENCV